MHVPCAVPWHEAPVTYCNGYQHFPATIQDINCQGRPPFFKQPQEVSRTNWCQGPPELCPLASPKSARKKAAKSRRILLPEVRKRVINTLGTIKHPIVGCFYCASLHNTLQNQGAVPESDEIIRFVIWSLLLQRSARISMQLLKNIGSGFHAVDFACFHLFSGPLMTQPDTFPPLKSEIKQSHPRNPKATLRSTAFL